jgi:glycosyltransferase involved in cell wall biosynthesis
LSRPTAPGQRLPAAPPEPEPHHFLYVGDAEPRKNLAALQAAHARYRERAQRPLPLVVAGAAGEPVGAERLAALYAGAAAVVHPALHEGFGLTLAEAMRAGVPVLAGRSPGVVETAGDAALYADPRDPEDLARALERLAADAALRAALSERGRSRAGRLSWAGSARAHISAYTLALG